MDVDWIDDEIILYPSHEEVNKLLMGEEMGRRIAMEVEGEDGLLKQKKKDILIQPEIPKTNNTEHYDDTLEALRKAYKIMIGIQKGEIPSKKEAEKIKNTYKYYKKQQQKYR